MLAFHGMNGMEALAVIAVVVLIFVFSGPVIVGPLAMLCGFIGGRLKTAALVLGIAACVLGVVSLVLGASVLIFLMYDRAAFGIYVLFLLPPPLSISFGVIALRLRNRKGKYR